MDKYNIIIVPLSEEDGGGFAGYVPDLPGCMSDGETRVEAIKNTEDAIVEWIATQKKRNLGVPKAGSYAKFAQQQRDKMTQALDGLLKAFNNLHPRVEALDTRVEELEKELVEVREVLLNLEERESFERIAGMPSGVAFSFHSQEKC